MTDPAVTEPEPEPERSPPGRTRVGSYAICLDDADGPTGTPVKDAQRTKTHDGTRNAIIVVWGTSALAGRTAQATAWYRALCETIPGATTESVELGQP